MSIFYYSKNMPRQIVFICVVDMNMRRNARRVEGNKELGSLPQDLIDSFSMNVPKVVTS